MEAKLQLQYNENGTITRARFTKQVSERGGNLQWATTSTSIINKWMKLTGTGSQRCEYYDTGMLRSLEMSVQISKTGTVCLQEV